MNNIKQTSIGLETFQRLKLRFSEVLEWDSRSSEIESKCLQLPPMNDSASKDELVKQLKDLYKFLINNNFDKEESFFIKDLADKIEAVKQISLYSEKDDLVTEEALRTMCDLSMESEGIDSTPYAWNYEQLKKITNYVYEKKELIKFFISTETVVQGKITAEYYEYPQEVPIAVLAQKVKKTDYDNKKRIFLFGEPMGKSYTTMREIYAPLRFYQFISEHQQVFLVLSKEPLELGDYILTGVMTRVNDFRSVSDTKKIITKLPILFIQKAQNQIIRYTDHADFKKQLVKLKVNYENLFEIPFLWAKDNTNIILKHPYWFKLLIWAWLLHCKEGLHPYPLHLFIAGPQQSGKSMLLNPLHRKSNENLNMFSGSSSTLKKLIPSFKYNPAKMGYLAETSRFAFCDEFLRILVRQRQDDYELNEQVGMMNDLLEHQKREAGSGISSVKVNMSSRMLATTNPVKGIKNMTDLLSKMDHAFMSRILVYWQNNEHIHMIRDSNDGELKTQDYDLEPNLFISLIDYLQKFKSDYDEAIVLEIYERQKAVLSESLLDHYSSRHKHHICCLMDGLVKKRCLMARDMSFKAVPKDYDDLELVWSQLISSWIDASHIDLIPIKNRINYLPEDCQYLFNVLCNAKRPLAFFELKDLGVEELPGHRFITAVNILREKGLLFEADGLIKPYYMAEGYNDNLP